MWEASLLGTVQPSPEEGEMVKLFDTTFFAGSFLVLAALAVAFLALTRSELPLVGTGVGALIAVAVIGMAGCAVGGISQAATAGQCGRGERCCVPQASDPTERPPRIPSGTPLPADQPCYGQPRS